MKWVSGACLELEGLVERLCPLLGDVSEVVYVAGGTVYLEWSEGLELLWCQILGQIYGHVF